MTRSIDDNNWHRHATRGAGKGSDPRPVNKKNWDKNYGSITWNHRAASVSGDGSGEAGAVPAKKRGRR